MVLLISLIGGAVAAGAATGVTIRALGRRAILDVPNQRSSHTSPTIRGGGIGLAIGALVALGIARTDFVGTEWLALAIAGVAFGAIGLLDDVTGGTPIAVRVGLQIGIAAVVVTLLWQHQSYGPLVAVLAGAGATIWIVAFVNVFNFMDGINGISCAQAIAAGLTFGLVAWSQHHLALQAGAFALVAASIGFAPFNFPTARVFPGDVGSYFAGAWLGVLVIVGLRASIPAEAMIAPVVLYVADTGVTLVRRIHRREAWLEAHRQHGYQRLVDLGWSHTQTTGLVFVIVALCSALGSVSLLGSLPARVVADCGVVMVVGGYLVLPTRIEHRRSTRFAKAEPFEPSGEADR